MSQERRSSSPEVVGDVDESIGYLLKKAAWALRSRMDAALRPLGLSVPQYACLELLGQRPGLSNAELARGVFVTRQSMNGVLRGLQERRLVDRPSAAAHGRALPAELTAEGRRQLGAASAAVRAVEQQMLSLLPERDVRRLGGDLVRCVDALEQTPAAGHVPDRQDPGA